MHLLCQNPECSNALPPDATAVQRYCGATCKARARYLRKRTDMLARQRKRDAARRAKKPRRLVCATCQEEREVIHNLQVHCDRCQQLYPYQRAGVAAVLVSAKRIALREQLIREAIAKTFV